MVVPPSRCDFRGRAHGHEATLLALFSGDGIKVAGVSLEAFEQFLQRAFINVIFSLGCCYFLEKLAIFFES
jgi:hypothetical protein